MNKRLNVVIFLVLSLAGLPSLAWNSKGHMTVAEIAWQNMDDATKKAIAEILARHPHKTAGLFMVDDEAPTGVDKDERNFLLAATWPDWVRPSQSGPPRPKLITKYHRANWHFINLPYVLPADADHNHDVPAPQGETVLTALADAVKVLKDKQADPADRAVKLCWLVHLVGDIHQPLHCTALISDDFKAPKGDEGGNLIAIKPHTAPMKLHAFWDDLLGSTSSDNPSYKGVELLATGIVKSSQLSRATLAPEMEIHQKFNDWANDSLELAKSLAYLDGDLPIAKFHKNIRSDEVGELPLGYESDAREAARKQVALAGYRLADLLKKILKPAPPG